METRAPAALSDSACAVDGPLARPREDAGSAGERVRKRIQRWRKRMDRARAEEELLGAGEPDLAIGRVVLFVLTPVLVVASAVALREPDNRFALACLATGGVAIVWGTVSNWLQTRVRRPSRLLVMTIGFYAVLISGLLYAAATVPHERLHTHWVIFFVYFLLIGGTGLTSDPRRTLVAGVCSTVGYFAILGPIHQAAAAGAPMAVRIAPEFEWVANSAKIGLLGAATFLAFSSASRGQDLRRMSLRDGLTGLLNRHAFDRCLAYEARVAEREDRPLAVAMIDIDHFKQLNDAHGHAAGDAALRWLARVLRRFFRGTDVVARYGGEEFVVAFLGAKDVPLAGRLEDLRTQIEQTSLSLPGASAEARMTVSIGVAFLPSDGDDVSTLLELADGRLYEAKRAGRNRIVGREVPSA